MSRFRMAAILLGPALLAFPLLSSAVLEAREGPEGYLASGDFDILPILPPAPRPGDARAKADRAIFRTTRKLVGTPRWDLAVNDVKLTSSDMLRDFSCAAGLPLTPEKLPAVMALIGKASRDTSRSSQAAKMLYQRKRPYEYDRGRICQPAEELKTSPDYPSGHTTLGWTYATILAELMPDRATAILARGRAYGESRIVCGVHNASAVEGGRLTAAATLTAVRATPAFKSDFAFTATELAQFRASSDAMPAGTCAAEATLVAQPIM